jgi:hypothetical protein
MIIPVGSDRGWVVSGVGRICTHQVFFGREHGKRARKESMAHERAPELFILSYLSSPSSLNHQ